MPVVAGGLEPAYFHDTPNRPANVITVSGSGANAGYVNFFDVPIWASDSSTILPKSADVDIRYVYRFLLAIQPYICTELATGAAQPHVYPRDLAKLEIPLPSLEEQRRIVVILDKVFERLDLARANAKANLRNTQELFNESVSRVFDNAREQAFRRRILADVANFRNGLNYNKSSQGETVKIVGVGDFKDNFELPLQQLSEVTIEGKLSKDDHLEAGDILAVRSNGNRELIGRTMLIPEMDEPVTFSGFTIRIRLRTEELLPDFLCEYLKTRAVRQSLTRSGGGANISNLTQSTLSALDTIILGIEAQCAVVSQIRELRSMTEQLRESHTQRLQKLTELTQSLLHNTFSGELT